MKTIHFVGGEKGGVGKSVFARLLSQYHIDNTLPYIGLDADRSHATLTRYYEDYTRPVDLDHFESTDQIVELALENEADILVDLPSQSERFLNRWLEENDVIGMCDELQINVIYWYLVDDGNDSVKLLKNFLAKYGNTLNCVVVKNQGRGSDFAEIDAVIARAETQGVHTFKSVTLPALHTATMHKIDKLNFSFWGAANIKDSGEKHLSLMERQRSKVWLRKAYALFDSVMNGQVG